MARNIHQVVVILLALIIGLSAQAADNVPGEVLVHLRTGSDIEQFNDKYGTNTLSVSSYSTYYRLAIPFGVSVQDVVASMTSDPDVINVSANLLNKDKGTATALPAFQWISHADTGGTVSILPDSANESVHFGPIASRYNGNGIIVAILDTGISKRNPLLGRQVIKGWDFINNSDNTDDRPVGTDSNENGISDEAVGHGTMVAGIVARFAKKASLLPVRVLDSDGQGTLWATLEGIHYAVAKGARVINLSFGSTQPSLLLREAIEDAYANNVLVISAAGNDNAPRPNYPADISAVINVAALNDDGTKASFSNYGRSVDLDAPGVDIISIYWDGNYASWSGTSFASPMVSAEAALIVSAVPEITVDALRQRMLAASHSVDSLNPDYVGMLGKDGAGLIDMDLALSGL